MAKRKRSTVVAQVVPAVETPVPLPPVINTQPGASRGAKKNPLTELAESNSVSITDEVNVNVVENGRVVRASGALRKREFEVATSRRALSTAAITNGDRKDTADDSDSPLSDLLDVPSSVKAIAAGAASGRKSKRRNEAVVDEPTKSKSLAEIKRENGIEEEELIDPEAEDVEEPTAAEEIEVALARPPPVHSDYLPLPWKGRLGYACLCTYLRYSKPPVFCSRTTRIASIMERRHPLHDPDMPHHPTKNRPDRDQTPDIARGQAYVEELGLANARDLIKLIKWNDRFGIKFLRLSSEMFPFASHGEYGYKLAPFASEVLAEAGRVAAELGHRLTTHPGQFTQLGSPRDKVIEDSIRDLEYHSEMLSLLKLPPQLNRDAVMILHMGGAFGDKQATLERFRKNYKRLSQDIKNRLVLENDDVIWSVHDLLPICKELNIPLVLDYHHHNIVHSDEVREGTLDIMSLYDEIRETWTRKGITQKMHYSEPEPKAVTARQRRKHSPRVATLPPCAPDMDLMIEAKDKEQAVFELMRTFKLPGWNLFNDIIPHVRVDENQPVKQKKKATPKKKKTAAKEEQEFDDDNNIAGEDAVPAAIPEEEIGMGGPDRRVYWPPGMEDWLRPVKRVVKKKDHEDGEQVTTKKRKLAIKETEEASIVTPLSKTKVKVQKTASAKKRSVKVLAAKVASDEDQEVSEELPNLSRSASPTPLGTRVAPARKSARAKKVNYAETDGE